MNQSKGRLIWSAQTHPGRVRKSNEDAFLILRFDPSELNYLGKEGNCPMDDYEFLFAISDGMGGEKAGAFASRIVIQSLSEILSREFHQRQSIASIHADHLKSFCQQIHDRARHLSRFYEECRGMGATLSLGWIQKKHLHIAHLGDSRLYHLPKSSGIFQLTEDHTIPGRMFRAGKLSEREARQHPYRHRLEKSIGCQSEPIDPQILSIPFEWGDAFLLCSDGITEALRDACIEKILRTPPPYLAGLLPAERLVKEALESSGKDNLTALVFKIE